MRHVISLLIMLTLVLLIGTGGALVVYQHYAAELPDYQQLVDYYPPTMSRVYAGDGRVLGSATSSYDLIAGLSLGHKEQDPATWLKAVENFMPCLKR